MNSGSEAAPSSTQSSAVAESWQMLAQLLFVAACISALIFAIDICVLLLSGSGLERRDFISYWASGQQLVHDQNPYDSAAILALEHSLGFPANTQALIVRNPPTALLLVAPLGLIGFRVGALLWSALLLGCWGVSVWLMWTMLEPSKRRLNVFGYSLSPGLVPLLFAPALSCVFYGQTALFALLGLTLFLRLHESHSFLAGISLWLCAVKPHLFLPFAVVLILWIVVSRTYAVLAGFVLAVAASSIAVFLFDPQAWSQYAQMMRSAGLEREFIPCLSIALRFVINPNSAWLQYVPATAGCVWAVHYYWRRRIVWNWVQHGPLLVLVSMLLSPYSWMTDQALALPALLQAAFRTSFRKLLILALASSAIEIAIHSSLSLHSSYFLWTAPAWFAWYVYALPKAGKNSDCLPGEISRAESDFGSK